VRPGRSDLDSLGLRENIVIVTGASSGIGAATARAFGRAGAHVVIAGRDAKRLDDVAQQIQDSGGTALPVEADFLQRGDAVLPVDAAVAAHGRIDVVVCAAGFVERIAFADQTPETLDRMWRVNAQAPFLTTQAAVPHLTEGSAVLFMSSSGAHRGFPGLSAYSASKGAVEALARTLAVELGPRTRVNTLMPGFVLTPMNDDKVAMPGFVEGYLAKTPAGFLAEADDLADTAVFLCSKQASYITGTTVRADGGAHIKG
jgi:NAD(P)-dependent dehydrogenase (short-subunit alcohol dehydrogenase family)